MTDPFLQSEVFAAIVHGPTIRYHLSPFIPTNDSRLNREPRRIPEYAGVGAVSGRVRVGNVGFGRDAR